MKKNKNEYIWIIIIIIIYSFLMSNIYLALGVFLIISNLNLGVTQWLPTYEAFRDANIDDLNGTI